MATRTAKSKASKKTTKKAAAKKASRSAKTRSVRKSRSSSAPKPRKSAAPAAAKAAAKGVATAERPRPARRPLSKEFKRFRDLLLEKQRELTEAYNISQGDSRSKLDDGTEDYIDYAASSYAREFLLSLTELDRKQLMLVEDALGRINTGQYGRCLQCGKIISRKRLEVAPWAQHCVRCQELEEQGLLSEQAAAEEIEEPERQPLATVDLGKERVEEQEEYKGREAASEEDEQDLEQQEFDATDEED